MAYSSSAKTVERQLEMLKLVAAGQECSWLTEEGGAPSLAYKLREALYAASMNNRRFPALAKAHKTMVIKIMSPREVRALFRSKGKVKLVTVDGHEVREEFKQDESVPDLTVGENTNPVDAPALPTMVVEAEPAPPMETPVIKGVQTQFSVIDNWLKHKEAGKIHFPEAALELTALAQVHRWAKAQNPPLMLMCDPPDPALTLSLIDPDVAEFQWMPES